MTNLENVTANGIIDDIGGAIGDVIGGVGDTVGDLNPLNVFKGIGDFFKSIIELASLMVKNVGPLFEFIFFIINQIIDIVYGTITLINGVGKEFVELMPHLDKIMELTLDAIDFLINFYKENSKLLIVSVMLVPAYTLVYLLIRQINAIF